MKLYEVNYVNVMFPFKNLNILSQTLGMVRMESIYMVTQNVPLVETGVPY
jgi:hypothetical protein